MTNFINILKQKVLPVIGVILLLLFIVKSTQIKDSSFTTSLPGVMIMLFGGWGLLSFFYKGESKAVKGVLSTLGSLAFVAFLILVLGFLTFVIMGGD